MPLFTGSLTTGKMFNGDLFKNQVTSWDLTVVATAPGQSYSVRLLAGTTPNINIAWGDGSKDNYTSLDFNRHVYASAGEYVIRISGSFATGGLIRLQQYDPDVMTLKDTGIFPPTQYLSGITSVFRTFNNVELQVNLKTGLFKNIAGNISSVSRCFLGTTGLTGTDVPVDIFDGMINCTVFTGVFEGITFTTTSYSNLLIRMAATLTQTGMDFHGGGSKYNTAGATARSYLTGTLGWTITDGGPA
jgi:hypothetical protein